MRRALMLALVLEATVANSQIARAVIKTCSAVVSNGSASPPDWASDVTDPLWQGTCYVDLGTDLNVTREEFAARCRAIPGYRQFIGDYGSGHNTCVFAGEAAAPSEAVPPSSDTPAPAAAEGSSDPDQRRLDAEADAISGDRSFLQGWGKLRSGQFAASQVLLRKSIDEFFMTSKILSRDKITVDPYHNGGTVSTDTLRQAVRHSICLNSIAFDFDYSSRGILDDSDISHTLGLCHEWDQTEDLSAYYLERLKRLQSWERGDGMKRTYDTPPEILAADACIEATQTRQVSSACDFKEGVAMFQTSLRIASSNGCPNQLTAGYLTTYDPGVQKISLTLKYQKLWTCGSGPTNLRVVPH